MVNGRKSGEAYRMFKICVDSYRSGELKGTLCHPGMETEGTSFQSLTQMLIQIDNMMNDENFPQSFSARRLFVPLPPPKEDCWDTALHCGKKATFMIRVLFRQHASWQGSVTWMEGHNEEMFRSVLELVLLMDSALGGCPAA